MEAESVFAWEDAHSFYREALKFFPDIKKMFLQSMDELESKIVKKENLAEYIPEFLKNFCLYRVVSFADPRVSSSSAEPILSTKIKRMLKLITYHAFPGIFFSNLGPMLLYLLKIVKIDPKIYPIEDVLFLLELMTKEILPARDYRAKLFFWNELIALKPSPIAQKAIIAKHYEKLGKTKAYHNYFIAAFLYRQAENFVDAIHTLQNIIFWSEKESEDNKISLHYQLEALRCLGILYEKRALKEPDEEKKVQYGSQAVLAYQNTAEILLKTRDASWLAVYLLEKSAKLCDMYYLETEKITKDLQSAKIKFSQKAEEEHTGKALIIADEEDLGCADWVADSVWQEKIMPEIVLPTPQNFVEQKPVLDYVCSLLLISSFAPSWKNAYEHFSQGLPWGEKKTNGGWFVEDNANQPRFILLGDYPTHLYEVGLEFCKERIFRRNIP
jgi:hypothetical protein